MLLPQQHGLAMARSHIRNQGAPTPTPTRLSACQVLKLGAKDFQFHNSRASHKFHFLWNEKTKGGGSKSTAMALYYNNQECGILTQGPYWYLVNAFPFHVALRRVREIDSPTSLR